MSARDVSRELRDSQAKERATRQELDAALAVIATLSDRLAEEKRIADVFRRERLRDPSRLRRSVLGDEHAETSQPFDLEAEAQACATRLARNQAVHDRAREILAGSHVAFDDADVVIDRGESLLDPLERIEDGTRNVDEIPDRFFGGHDDSSAPGRPDTAHGTNVEGGARGGHDSGPRVDAEQDGAA